VPWFAPLSTERHRREIWTVGFHHELPQRKLCRHFAHCGAVLECDDAGERNEMIETQHFIRLFERAAKAMKDAAQLVGIRFHDLERVVPSVALMNHYIEPEFHREIELLLKQTRLARLVGAV